MERSKCIICGKTRRQKYLTQFNDLQGYKRWVCNRTVGYNPNYFQVGSTHYSVHPCQISYLRSMYNKLIQIQNNYLAAKKSLYIYDKISQEKNVAPELTFLLQ